MCLNTKLVNSRAHHRLSNRLMHSTRTVRTDEVCFVKIRWFHAVVFVVFLLIFGLNLWSSNKNRVIKKNREREREREVEKTHPDWKLLYWFVCSLVVGAIIINSRTNSVQIGIIFICLIRAPNNAMAWWHRQRHTEQNQKKHTHISWKIQEMFRMSTFFHRARQEHCFCCLLFV